MKVDILAPGPSLSQYDSRRKPEVRICINRAILAHSCDWWAVQDITCWNETKTRPEVGLLTTSALRERLGGRLEHLVTLPLKPAKPDTNWTAPRTVETVVANWPECEIHLWGFDMVGQEYFDGTLWKSNGWCRTSRRTAGQWEEKARLRWQREEALLKPFLSLPNIFHHKAG